MKELDRLIERLRKEYGYNGVFAILRESKKELSIKNEHYNAAGKIIGFLWGLRAVDYIDDETMLKINDEIWNM